MRWHEQPGLVTALVAVAFGLVAVAFGLISLAMALR